MAVLVEELDSNQGLIFFLLLKCKWVWEAVREVESPYIRLRLIASVGIYLWLPLFYKKHSISKPLHTDPDYRQSRKGRTTPSRSQQLLHWLQENFLEQTPAATDGHFGHAKLINKLDRDPVGRTYLLWGPWLKCPWHQTELIFNKKIHGHSFL